MRSAGEAGSEGSGAHARVTARFELHADGGQDAAAAAAELIHSLQELANAPDCACDLDVGIEWPRAAGNGGLSSPR